MNLTTTPEEQAEANLLDYDWSLTEIGGQPYQISTDSAIRGPSPEELHTSNDTSLTNSRVTTARTSTEPQHVQRGYKDRPCDSCRRRKTRCVYLQDMTTCIICKSRDEECTFLEEPRRRRRRKRTKKDSDDYDNSISPNNSSSAANSFEDYSELKGPSLLKKTLGLQHSRCSFLIGPTCTLDYSILDQFEYNGLNETEIYPATRLRKVSKNVIFSMQEDGKIEGFDNIKKNCDEIEKLVSPYGQILVDLYFRIIHPSYPILHKKVVLEKYARSYLEFAPPLLAAVYCLALNWWSYATDLPPESKPDSAALGRLAIKSFSETLRRPKLSTVQAGLLLLQWRPKDEGSWPLVSQVVAIAEELGLNLDCRDWSIPRWERKLRRRLAWAVWVQDKWYSLTYSRPSHMIYGINWLMTPLSDEDFSDKSTDGWQGLEASSDVTNGRLLFQQMVTLSLIVDDILSSLYTPVAVRDITGTIQILQVAKPLQAKLRQWVRSLPPDTRMSSLKNRQFCSNGYLYLAYLAAEITLHRRIIHSLNESTPLELVTVCRNAAKERLVAALDFARNLRPEHIQAFWHSSSSTNFAIIGSFAALLMIKSKTNQESEFFRDLLKNYRWVIRVSSVGSEQMSIALQKLDAVILNLPCMAEDHLGSEYVPRLELTVLQSDSEYSDDDDFLQH